MKKALVIGSNSFSGSHYINYLLKKNFIVIGVSRSSQNPKYYLPYNKNHKNFKFYKYAIGKNTNQILTLIKKYKINYVVNYGSQSMVAESWKNSEDWFLTNSYHISVLYKKISELKIINKLVHISTPEVYGSNNKLLVENYSFNPNTPYAISRTTADYYLRSLYKFDSFPFITLRASNVYGENQRLYRIIPKAIDYFHRKKKLPVHGKGSSMRSFIHIKDVCEATFVAMRKGKNGESFHVSTNEYITISNLLKLIAKIMKVDLSKYIKFTSDRKGKDGAYKLNSRKIRKLGWKNKIKLSHGIQKVINWYLGERKNFKIKDYIYVHKK